MDRRCNTKYCINEPPYGRRKCEKCKSRNYRAKHELMTVYIILRSNAKARGIKFELTFDYFKAFCKSNNYLRLRGTNANDMTIDRVKPWLGYINGNIQMLTKRQNSSKRFKDQKARWAEYKSVRDPDVPF